MSTLPPQPVKKLSPPPPAKPSPASTTPANRQNFSVKSGVQDSPLKVVAFGPGGIGKTELMANIAQLNVRPLFIDLEQGSHYLPVDRLDSITTFGELRDALHNEQLFAEYDAVVIDSATKAEEMAAAWVIENVPHEKGHACKSIEGYGFGKGYVHIYDAFLNLLGDLDALHRRGKHVLIVAHDCTASVPNPAGEDWLQYQPRLQSPKHQGKVRERVKEWCDHLLYIGYDVAVKDGKASGSGTRAIYVSERPTFWAKSRTLANEIIYDQGSCELWKQLLNRGN